MGAEPLTAAPLPTELVLAPQTPHFSGHGLLIPRVSGSRDQLQAAGWRGEERSSAKKPQPNTKSGLGQGAVEGCECLPSLSLNKQLINHLILFLDPFIPSEEHS